MENPDTLRAKLAALRRLIRLAMLATGWGKLLCVATVLLLLDFGVDRTLRLPHGARLILLCLWGGVLLWQFGRQSVLPLLRSLPDGALVLELEERRVGPADLLGSALYFTEGKAGGATSAALRSAAVRQAEAYAALMEPAVMVDRRRARRWLLVGLAAAALLALAGAHSPATARLWFRRNVLLAGPDWPRRTRLELLRAPRFVARGDKAEIALKAAGVMPRTARLSTRGLQSGKTRTLTMERVGEDVFVAELGVLEETTEFAARAGDGVLPAHRVEVVDRPEVAAARMVVRPPAYIADGPVELAWNAPVFEIPTGSEVTIVVEATKPLSAVSCRMGEGPSPEPQWAGERSAAFTFALEGDLRCELTLTDTVGIEGSQPLRVEIRALEDEPPEVRLMAAGVGGMLVPVARIPLRVHASDDYGAQALWLDQSHDERGVRRDYARVDLWQGNARRTVSVERVIDLRGRDLPPTGRFVLSAGARDNCTVGGPNTGRGAVLSFRLVTVHELLGALLLRQQDLRRDLEQQIQLQNDLKQRLGELLEPGPAEGDEFAELQRSQRALARVVELTGAGYGHVLAQLLNNRVMAQSVYESRVGGIVHPLARLAAADGTALRAADVVARAGRDEGLAPLALGLMEATADELKRVRSRMMLLESYASVVASVEEIADEERELLRHTRELQERVLEALVGE